MSSLCFLLLLLAVCRGSLFTKVDIFLDSKGEAKTIKSPKYPKPLPPNESHVWEITAEPNRMIAVMCLNVNIPEDESCQNMFVVNESGKREVSCQSVDSFELMSEDNRVIIEVISGPKGGPKIYCLTQSLKSSREASTQSIKDLGDLFFSKETEEVDSSEFGVVAGKKATSCKCGWTHSQPGQRIIGGREVQPHKYPFIVSVVRSGDKTPFCGGTILTPYHVLTAAHCTYDKLNTSLSVVIAEHNYKTPVSTSRFVAIKKVFVHEYYNKNTAQSDLAILLTAGQIPFTDLVGPLCLPSTPIDVTKKAVKLLGWGRQAEYGPLSDYLKEANFRVTEDRWCHHYYPNLIPEGSTNYLCIYAQNRGGCRGDSGGPVMWLDPDTNMYTLVGVASMTWTCGQLDPMVCTKVSSYLDWINKKVEVTHPMVKTCSKVN